MSTIIKNANTAVFVHMGNGKKQVRQIAVKRGKQLTNYNENAMITYSN